MPVNERAICTVFDIGKRISLRRQELGLTQEALAERIEVTCQQVQRYEYGKNRLNVEKLQRIARALAVPTAYFFHIPGGGEQAPKEEDLDQAEQKMVELFRRIESGDVRVMMVKMLQAAGSAKKRGA